MSGALPFIAAGTAALSKGLGVIGTIRQTQAQNVSTIAGAEMDEQEAKQAEAQAKADEDNLRFEQRQNMGARLAEVGASGLTSEGSKSEILSQNNRKDLYDILQTRQEGALNAARFRNQSVLARAQARNNLRLMRLQLATRMLNYGSEAMPSLAGQFGG